MVTQHGLRLSTRIIIGAMIIVALCALAWVLTEEAHFRDVYKNELRANLEKSLNAEKLRLLQTIKTLRQDVLFLSNTPPVSGIVHAASNHGYDVRDRDTPERWKTRLQQVFSAFSAANPDYFQIRLIGVADEGREIVRVNNRGGKIEITPPGRLQAKAGRDYFKATLGLHAGEVHISEFNLNQEWGLIEQPYRPTLRAATPVFTPSGQIFGMVVINMEAGRLLEPATLDLRPGVQTYIAGMNGEYLLHPDPSRSFGFELGRLDKITTDFPFLKTMFIPGTSGHFPLQSVETRTGAQYWIAERIHFDAGDPARFLVLAYSLPGAAAARQIITMPLEQIIGGLIAMSLVGGTAFLALRRMFSPLEQIAVAAGKIAAGSHDVLLPQTGSGEIGGLSAALGTMLSRLAQREQDILQINAKLEERVRERTFELNAINELLHGLRGKKLLQETEQLLRRNQALMLTSMDGIHVLDSQGDIVTANDAFCRMLGYTQEEAAGLNVADWDTQWTGEKLRERFMVPAGNSAIIESMHRRKDGALIDVEISIAGVVIEGEFLIFASSRDITGRKKNEEALRIAAAAFETHDAIVITDAQANIIRVNQSFSDITGYGAEEVMGRNLRILDLGQYDPAFQAGLWKQLAQEGKWAGEICGKRKDGQIYPAWLNITAIKNERQDATHYVAIFSDITARKRIEEARLRESEERFRGTLEQVAVGIAHATTDGCFQQVNQKFCEIVGYPRDELMRMCFQDITFPDDLEENIRYQRQLLAGEIPTFSMEKRYVRKDKTLVWVNLTVSLLRDAGGTPKYSIGVIEDITRRKRLEENLQMSETKFRTLYESSSDAIMLLDEEGFFDCNETTLRIFGCNARGDFIGKHPSQFSPPAQPGGQDSLSLANEHIAMAFGDGSDRFEWLHCRLDGAEFFADVLLTSMVLDGKQVLQAIVRDITGRKRAEQQLHDLTAHLQTVREEEKAGLAREIHDDLGGILTALKVDAYWLARHLPAGNETAPLRERVDSMSGLIVSAVGVTRRIITGLRPAILDDLGLLAAIEWQAAEFRKRTGIECHVVCAGGGECEKEVGGILSINLFRIFQEALTNVARHSGASRVEVKLQSDEKGISLSVSDNGCGMPEERTIATTSFGIRGMRERAGQMGGRIIFHNRPGGGLTMTVMVPLPAGGRKGGEA